MRIPFLFFCLVCSFPALAEVPDRAPVAATTAEGDPVLLHPTGKWEYLNPDKAAAARKIAEQFPENRVRPVDAQGGWFPGTRTLMPGDPGYNRSPRR